MRQRRGGRYPKTVDQSWDTDATPMDVGDVDDDDDGDDDGDKRRVASNRVG